MTDAARIPIGKAQFDPNLRQIHRAGRVFELSPKAFGMLALFLAEPNTLHSRPALFERVWKNRIVEDNSLDQMIRQLRVALGDDAKQIIRTVRGSGFVFVPPPTSPEQQQIAASEILTAEVRPPPTMPFASTLGHEAAALPKAVPKPVAAGKALALRWSLGLLTLLLAMAWLNRQRLIMPAGESTPVMLHVALDADAAPLAPLAAYFSERLEFQLLSTPGVRLLQDPRSSLKPRTEPPHDADDVLTFAIVSIASGALQLEVHDGADVPAASISVADPSPAVLDRAGILVSKALPWHPERWWRGSRQVADGLDAEHRLQYGQALAYLEQHDLARARQTLEEVLREYPDYGPAHLRLAELLDSLGQVEKAQLEAQRAGAWASSLPPELRERIEARLLVLRQQYYNASKAYARLTEEYPDDISLWLAKADAMLRERKANSALRQLERKLGLALRPYDRYRLLRTAGIAANVTGDVELSSARSLAALNLAAEHHWTSELLTSEYDKLIREGIGATPEMNTDPNRDIPARLKADGRELESAFASLQISLADPAVEERERSKQVEALLARSRSVGDRVMEYEVLRMMSAVELTMGQFERHGALLEQAATTAAASRNSYGVSQVQATIAQREIFTGNFRSARKRLDLIKRDVFEDRVDFSVASMRATVLSMQGDFLAAEDVLQESGRAHLEYERAPMPEHDCLAGTIAVRRAQPEVAEAAFEKCQSRGAIHTRARAMVARAGLAALQGNQDLAMALLAESGELAQRLGHSMVHGHLSLLAADVLADLRRYDEAESRVIEARSMLRGSGARMLDAWSARALGECRLRAGDTQAAADLLAEAEALTDPSVWQLRHRQRLLEAQIVAVRNTPDAAMQQLRAILQEADRRDDVLASLRVSAAMLRLATPLAPGQEQDWTQANAQLTALVQRSGYRGLALD